MFKYKQNKIQREFFRRGLPSMHFDADGHAIYTSKVYTTFPK